MSCTIRFLFSFLVLGLLTTARLGSWSSSAIAQQTPPPLIAYDGAPWQFAHDTSAPIVVIGDLAGDHGMFARMVRRAGLIDHRGHWIGGRGHLVLLGDLNDRGDDTLQLLTHITQLEHEAAQAGGHVHALLGNHDIFPLIGMFRREAPLIDTYLGKKEARAFRGYRAAHPEITFTPPPLRSFAPESVRLANPADYEGVVPVNSDELDMWATLVHRFGDFYRRRNTIIQIGHHVFVHGGLPLWLRNNAQRAGQMNTTMRAWVTALTQTQHSADSLTRLQRFSWVLFHSSIFGINNSPLWIRDMANEGAPYTGPVIGALFDSFNAASIFVGHTPRLQPIALEFGVHQTLYLMDSGNSYSSATDEHGGFQDPFQPGFAVIQPNGTVSFTDVPRPPRGYTELNPGIARRLMARAPERDRHDWMEKDTLCERALTRQLR